MRLQRLIAEAIVLAGGKHQCAELGHDWQTFGGRQCPRNPDAYCSQAVYECRACGFTDYGYPGGPGHRDCYTEGPCSYSCDKAPATVSASEVQK